MSVELRQKVGRTWIVARADTRRAAVDALNAKVVQIKKHEPGLGDSVRPFGEAEPVYRIVAIDRERNTVQFEGSDAWWPWGRQWEYA